MFKTFCKRVIGKFRFQKKEWLMMKGETTALCSKTRVTFANNSNLQKQEQNSQYFETKLDTQDFLYNIRQSLVYCHGKKLISTRLELASTHIEAIIDGVVSYLYEFPLVPFLVFVHIKWRKKFGLTAVLFLIINP